MKLKFLMTFALLCAVAQGAWGQTDVSPQNDQPNWEGTGTGSDPFLIQTSTDFEAFANSVNNGETFSNKTFQMKADISTTVMVGDYNQHAFSGTFDGNGCTLTINYTGLTEERTGPFRRLIGATIKNLHVDGIIETSAPYAGGIVGYFRGASHILNCRSSVTIKSSCPGLSRHGGIAALKANYIGSQPTVEGCVFDGKILTIGETASTNCAGIVGYTNFQTLTIKNCLYKPASISNGETAAECATVYNNATEGAATSVECNNCYYTKTFGNAQGKIAHTYEEAPPHLGTIEIDYLQDYDGIQKAYKNGLLFGNKYYVGPVVFTDNANNDVVNKAEFLDDCPVDVILSGRTLYKDGSWNTLCLPFEVTESQIAETDHPLHGATIMELNTEESYYDSTDGTLYLYFDSSSDIWARYPYIVKWENDGSDDITDPMFRNVVIMDGYPEIAESVEEPIGFIGTYDPLIIGSNGNRTILYIGADNKLYYPDGAMTIGAFRAYFLLQEGLLAGSYPNGINTFVLHFGDEDDATGIIDIDHSSLTMDHSTDAWYTIDGLKLNDKPKAKGIYINNRRKVVIK